MQGERRDARRVAYFTSFGFVQRPDGEISSDVASVRYRVLLPARFLAERGWEIGIATLTEEHLQDPQATARQTEADIAVMAKVVDSRAVDVAAALKARGLPVIADFCDNHFLHPQLGPLYRGLAGVADRCTANSATMAEVVAGLTGTAAAVVFDPVEGPRNAPRFAPSPSSMTLAWYGFPNGLPFLFRRLAQWQRDGLPFPLDVEIVTALSDELAHDVDARNRAFGDRYRLSTTPWSIDAVWHAIARADAVLVPSELDDLTRTKSANRLMEAIYGGRLAFATMLPSYREFESFCLPDSGAGVLALAMRDQDAMRRKIEAGQDYIAQRYLPVHAALAWDTLFRTLVRS